MLKITQIICQLNETLTEEQIARKLHCRPSDILSFSIERESLDARRDDLHYSYTVLADLKNEEKYLRRKDVTAGQKDVYIPLKPDRPAARPVIAGFGPAGMFAGLILAEAGMKPLIIERGRCVEERSADVQRFFAEGILDPVRTAGHEKLLLVMILLAIFGFGTKAGMYPMHGWLPAAHPIAPAPASSLLSGIIVKAGILAVIRMVYYTVGADFVRGTFVQYIWMSAAMLTVFMGSTMAFLEKNLKKRLAYSSVSQLSYIMTALSVLTPQGLQGGLLHVMAHFCAKGCLFLTAGVFIYKMGIRDVRQLKGIGKSMPRTTWCIMLSALSLVGIPPMGGFLSKWVIAMAAVEGGSGFWAFMPPAVLLISALLTAGYLFPLVIDGFFPGEDANPIVLQSSEPSGLMVVPMAVLCAVSLAAGLFGLQILGALGI